MRNRIAKSGFSQMSDSTFLLTAATIKTAMKGNANFEDAKPSVVEVSLAFDDYKLKLENANRKGSPLDTSLKDESRLELEDLLKQLAFFVNTASKGLVSVILSSGFPISAEPQKSLTPLIPGRVRMNDYRQSGQLRLDFDPVKGAWKYEYCVTDKVDDGGNPVWEDAFRTTKATGNLLAPVLPGNRYWVRVRAENGQGYSDWSTPESIIAR